MDTFWITFGNDFDEGYKPDFRIHFNKPEQDEGYQCIKVCSYEVVEKLETQNARYREALKEVESEGCSDICLSMKKYRPSYYCHVEIAQKALKEIE